MSRSRSSVERVGDSPVVPHGHEAVDPGQDLPADEPAEGGLVEGAVGGERGDEGGERAAQHRAGRRGRGRSVVVGRKVGVIGGPFQAAIGSRAMSSSTMGSKEWRPGGARRAVEPVGGGEDPGGVGRPIAGGQAQLDGLAGGIEADEVHPRRRAGPDRDDLEVVGGRQARVGGDDPPGEVEGGARRSVALRAAVPLDEVRIERVERPEQLHGGLDQPAEQDDAEAEVRRRDGGRAVLAEQRLDAVAVAAPAGRRDDERPAAGLEAGRQVGDDGVAAGGLDDEVGAGQVRPDRVGRPAGARGRGPSGLSAAPRVEPTSARRSRPRDRARRRRG